MSTEPSGGNVPPQRHDPDWVTPEAYRASRCPTNLIDTVVLRIAVRLGREDLDVLKQKGFVRPGTGNRSPTLRDEYQHFYGTLVDPKTGVSVRAGPQGIRVQGSLPRVLGRSGNIGHELLSREEVKDAIHLRLARTCPHALAEARETKATPEGITVSSAFSFPGYAICGLDVARNFPGDVRLLLPSFLAYRPARFRSRLNYERERQLLFKGRTAELAIYDKGAESNKLDAGRFGRVELRCRTRRSLERLTRAWPEAAELSLLVRPREGQPELRRRACDPQAMNETLWRAVRDLGPLARSSAVLAGDPRVTLQPCDAVAHLALACPEQVAALVERFSPKSRREFIRRFNQLRSGTREIDLMNLVPGWTR